MRGLLVTEFSLRSLIREVADESGAADPGALADAVFGRIPAKHRADALRESLRPFVRLMVSADRATRPSVEERPQGGTSEQGAKPSVRSWKRDGIRQQWRTYLRDRLHVADGWKFLGDCGFDDLMFAVTERREIAARTAAKADWYEQLAKVVSDHGAERVADLPDSVLDAFESEGDES